ncbi:MAG: tetratricopeptide repeat protein [Planctomycetaceae bacterium]|jgi:tetratricopeptide (TPR) repeat protein|nr:tetratricopeptide repeat protein [Planctomycetaceae bacterium]
MKIRTFNYFVTTLILSISFLNVTVNADESAEMIWSDPDALVREAFKADEEPERQAELEKHLRAHTVKILIEKGQVDEALEYAQKHDVLKDIRLFINALINKGRFDEAVELARTIPPDQHGDSRAQFLNPISFRQAQCARFDDALKTTSFLTGNWQWGAQYHIKNEERRCSLLKNGKPLRKFDGTLNDESTTFSIFRFGRVWAIDPQEPLVANLLDDNEYKPELVDAIQKAKEKKNDEAKTLFDKVIGNTPYKGSLHSGTITGGERLCGIAVIQFELGHADWAAETLSKIERLDKKILPLDSNNRMRFGRAIADVQVLLGDLDGAEKTLRLYFKLTDDPSTACTTVWSELARHLAIIGKQKEAAVILNHVLDHVKSIEHHFHLSDTVHIVLLAAHELKDVETKKKIFERASRYVAMRNNKTYDDAYLAVVEGYAREQMFVDALRFVNYICPDYRQQRAFALLIDAAFKAGSIDALKKIRSNNINDWASCVLISRQIARLAYDAGDMEEAKREIELAITMVHKIYFHHLLDRHAYMLDIAEDLRFFRQPKRTEKVSQ